MPHQHSSRHVAGFPTPEAGAARGAHRKYLPAAFALGGINVGIRVSGRKGNVFATVGPRGRGVLQRASRGFNSLSPRASKQQPQELDSGISCSVGKSGWLQTIAERAVGTVATAVLAASLAISLPADANQRGPPVPPLETGWGSNAEVASKAEDGLLEMVKQVEAKIDSTVQDVTSVIPTLRNNSPESAEEAMLARELVAEVWEVVDQNFLDARETGFSKEKWKALRDEELAKPSLRDRAAAYRAIKTMLARGLSDPYTRFITPKEFEAMRKYDLTGVGLNLGTGEEFIRKLQTELPRKRKPEDSGVWVLGLIKGSTADAAGIGQGDEVLEVDGESSDGKTPFQVSSALQGGPNSDRTVDITVAKAENGQVSRVTLERPAAQAITTPVNTQFRREGGRKVGYIRLTSFNALAQVDVAEAVRSMGAAGADELVLDLRDNRGGLVTSGIEVARLFLDSGSTVVVTKGAARNDRVLAPGPPLTTIPLTVLVNEHTASASEILAGALRDNCRATLVGARTYGKGLIQSVYELSDASGIVITVGKYLTPAGTNIDRDGIRPDFARTPPTSERDITLKACRIDMPQP